MDNRLGNPSHLLDIPAKAGILIYIVKDSSLRRNDMLNIFLSYILDKKM